ncbi:hypothetical protein Q3G72_031050 [Acer saccharum]|nr:hypothetical protein Q3G72_031050 [Acer saccharum]
MIYTNLQEFAVDDSFLLPRILRTQVLVQCDSVVKTLRQIDNVTDSGVRFEAKLNKLDRDVILNNKSFCTNGISVKLI